MQVSQAAEQENFVVVGGGQAQAFTIRASAHAFKILSDTLYSDKPRAVVREVLCNAVDAHIAAGIPDKPVVIKLSDSELSIQDFGPGIPDENIAEIYTAYFGSTKIQDDSQTGGFGLGSKAPFAYTDHFTVTSCHAGFRRVYALLVGDDDTDGAPAIKLMATAPCGDATGVTVSVPIEDKDQNEFRRHIGEVVLQGGMKATLNGLPLATRDYVKLRQEGIGFFPTESWSDHQLSVLYGNVLYPLVSRDGIRDEVRELESNWTRRDGSLILYAPPSSVTVTPAREALGYNPRTIATLKRLIKKQLHLLRTNKGKAHREAIIAMIEERKFSRENIAASYQSRHLGLKLSEPVYGAAGIAAHHARTAVFNSHYGLDKVIKVAARYFGEKRKLLSAPLAKLTHDPNLYRPLSPSEIKERRTLRRSRITFFQAQHQMVTRKLLRVVPKELWDSLRYSIGSGTMLLRKSRQSQSREYGSLTPMKLTISHRREAVADDRGYYLFDSKITDEQIEEIRSKASKFRFKLLVKAKVAPKPRVLKPKIEKAAETFHSLALDGKTHCARYTTVRAPSPTTISDPTAYLAWSPIRYKEFGYGISLQGDVQTLFAKISDMFPKTALVFGARNIEILEKRGVPTIESVVFDRLEALKASDHPVAYVRRKITEDNKRRYRARDSLPALFCSLMDCDDRLACAAMGIPFTKIDTDAERDALLSIARLFLDRNIIASRKANGRVITLNLDTYAERLAEIAKQSDDKADPRTNDIVEKLLGDKLGGKTLPHLRFFASFMNCSITQEDLSGGQATRLAEMIEAEIERLALPDPSTLDDNGDQT